MAVIIYEETLGILYDNTGLISIMNQPNLAQYTYNKDILYRGFINSIK